MNATTKTMPTHRVTFTDEVAKQSRHEPLAAGVVWPRKGGKLGGLLKWNISTKILGAGIYRLVTNMSNSSAANENQAKTYAISFAEQHYDASGPSRLGRPVIVASVDEDGIIHWSIMPDKLTDGALFVLEDRTAKAQSSAQERPLGRFNANNETRD